MRASGDWTTPVYPDGRPRFAKPLLSYWLIGLGEAAVGISLPGARLPFLLAGALLVGLTFATARRLLADDAAAILASAVVAGNAQIAALATRATPDILVCLGITASLHGVVRALGRSGVRGSDAGWLWLGSGLAVAAKGGLGLAAPAFALGFVAARRDPGLRARDLVRAPAFAAGLAVAAACVMAPALRHGSAAFAGLLADQVAGRVETSRVAPLYHLLVHVRSTIKNLAPWSMLVALAWILAPRPLRALVARTRGVHGLAVGWWTLVVAMFAMGSTTRGRYLAPSTPLLACLAAAHLHAAAGDGRAATALRRVCFAVLGTTGLCGLALLVAGARIDLHPAATGAFLLLVAGVGVAVARRGGPRTPLVVAAVAVAAALPLVDGGVRPLLDASPVRDVVARLTEQGVSGREVATLGSADSLGAQIRLASSGRLDPVSFPAGAAESRLRGFAAVVASAGEAERLRAAGWSIRPGGFSYGRWSAREVRALVVSERPETVRASKREWTWLASPPGAGGPPAH